MPTIEMLTQRAEPVSPGAPARVVYDRFAAQSDLMAIPVVEGERPVGLVERDVFLLRLAGSADRSLLSRPVSEVMDPEPAVVEAGVRIDAYCDILMRSGPGALLRGFIVTHNGVYRGIGTAVAMLQTVNYLQRRDNAELNQKLAALTDSRSQDLASARARSQFLSVMSHELRTPMNGVLAVAELLRRQPLGAAAQAHVQTIVDSSETLLGILQDALDLSRAEAGELELTAVPTPLRPMMDELQIYWQPRAAQDGVTLLVGYEGDTELAAVIDGGRLRQVFGNLIGNALKFARNGVVEASLKAWMEQGRLHMEGRVRDNGPGVDPSRVDAIFEPFVHEAGPNGAGLGLSVCRQVVDRMDGRIWAENNAGSGATFAFDLVADAALVETSAPSNVSDLAELELQTRPHVLIVDDNATNRVVAQALCEMFGCTSELAEDGLEALEAVQARPFDLILMDIKMPRMDGVQATQAIRALDGPSSEIPIVALTANADPDDAKHYLSIGMAAVVEKPIKPERLRMAMNTALSEAPAVAEAPARPARGRGRSAA